MTRTLVEISFQFPNWMSVVEKHKRELMLFQAALIQTNRGMLFDAEGAYNGRPKWAELKFRNGQILSKRGTLRKSIAPIHATGRPGADGIVAFNGDTISVGTKLLYARMMNDGTTKMPGGVLKPVRAKALKIPIPGGKQAAPAAFDVRNKLLKDHLRKLQAQFAASGNIGDTRKLSAKMRGIKKKIDLLEVSLRERNFSLGANKDEAFIFRKSVKIPARPFDDWNDEDQAEFDAAIANKVMEILNRG